MLLVGVGACASSGPPAAVAPPRQRITVGTERVEEVGPLGLRVVEAIEYYKIGEGGLHVHQLVATLEISCAGETRVVDVTVRHDVCGHRIELSHAFDEPIFNERRKKVFVVLWVQPLVSP